MGISESSFCGSPIIHWIWGLWVIINPQNMCTVCYDLHLCMYSALKVYIHPWELNLWPLCCWHSAWPVTVAANQWMNINRVLWFRTHKGFSHLKWVTLGQTKPWINWILHSLVSRFKLLRIYPGLTINPGYPYIGISHCTFLNPGLMFLFAYLWCQFHCLDLVYCRIYYRVFPKWTIQTTKVRNKTLQVFSVTNLIFFPQSLKGLFIHRSVFPWMSRTHEYEARDWQCWGVTNYM